MDRECTAPVAGTSYHRAADRVREGARMLTVGMILLGLVTFAAMIGFVTLCDRV